MDNTGWQFAPGQKPKYTQPPKAPAIPGQPPAMQAQPPMQATRPVGPQQPPMARPPVNQPAMQAVNPVSPVQQMSQQPPMGQVGPARPLPQRPVNPADQITNARQLPIVQPPTGQTPVDQISQAMPSVPSPASNMQSAIASPIPQMPGQTSAVPVPTGRPATRYPAAFTGPGNAYPRGK